MIAAVEAEGVAPVVIAQTPISNRRRAHENQSEG
jgi:hypothetical protein